MFNTCYSTISRAALAYYGAAETHNGAELAAWVHRFYFGSWS